MADLFRSGADCFVEQAARSRSLLSFQRLGQSGWLEVQVVQWQIVLWWQWLCSAGRWL